MRNDNDIEILMNSSDPRIRNVVDLFVSARSAVHILRAIEPQLRIGAMVRRILDDIQPEKNIPRCPVMSNEINNDNEPAQCCIHLASRKQMGDILVKMQELHKLK